MNKSNDKIYNHQDTGRSNEQCIIIDQHINKSKLTFHNINESTDQHISKGKKTEK